ncbi:MAG TPA: winged helix-turn-helix domain-containing protein [Nitrososphaeraceae archaeon]|nr:winged helix-turn-helix domain-containing protein [Nitrososphaeraceae archaeon]
MRSLVSSTSFERRKNRSNGGANRGKIQITADILSLCTVGTKKTHIMYKANLSYEQVNYYLADTLRNNFIEQCAHGEDGVVYRTTDKGREYLKYYGLLTELFKGKEVETQKAEFIQDASRFYKSQEGRHIFQS